MNKSIVHDALVLFLITLIAGLALGAANAVTSGPIAQAEEKEKEETYQSVFTDASEFTEVDGLDDLIAQTEAGLAEQGFGNVTVNNALVAKDASGKELGYVVVATSGDGYKGDIEVAVGITEDKKITGIGFVSIDETPGLGMKAKDPEFKDQFNDKDADTLELVKTDPTADNQIKAISGATYSSRATTAAVNTAVYFANNALLK
jgi:electron transport complex protein RnfG